MSAAPALTPRLTFVLALAAGVTVANIYYNQALLSQIGETFGAPASATAWVSIATQLGYASGLLLLVPLGDVVNRKKLLVLTAFGAAVAMLVVAFSANLGMAIAASYLLGLICITPQVAVPYGAGLAPTETRGRTVGVIMSGLLVGILGARVLAGFLGHWLGWRQVLACGSGFTLLIALGLMRLPSAPATAKGSYRQMLASLWPLLRSEPVLRRHSLLGALSFAAFSSFWVTLSFYLKARPEHFGSEVFGYFGLVAIAGVAIAPVAGRLSDRYGPRAVNGAALLIMVLSFAMMTLAGASIVWLVIATFLMDAGAQANQISNQTRIYAISADMRNRINSVYMVSYFSGGALGGMAGGYAWTHGGWLGACAVGGGFSILGLLVLLLHTRKSSAELVGR